MKFHHIGIACFNIKDTAKFYVELGYKKNEIVYDPIQNIYICFLTKDNEPCIELLAPYDDKSPVKDILKKKGVSPYHLCYTVADIEKSVSDLVNNQDFIQISDLSPAVAINNKRVCFLFSKNTELIELVEE